MNRCVYECVKKKKRKEKTSCVYEAQSWELSVGPSRCVLVVVRACGAHSGGGYVTAVMIGCGG